MGLIHSRAIGLILCSFVLAGCVDVGRDHARQEKTRLAAEQEARIRERIASSVQQAIDPLHPKVRAFALRMAGLSPGEYNIGQVCAIWYYLKDNWRYVSDPRAFDYFAPAFESIEAGLSGDCDDFAILMASCIEAIGGDARVVLSYDRSSAHAYCEVYMADDPSHVQELVADLAVAGDASPGAYIHFHRDRRGYWLNLDYSAGHPGGPFPRSLLEFAVFPDGRWEVLS